MKKLIIKTISLILLILGLQLFQTNKLLAQSDDEVVTVLVKDLHRYQTNIETQSELNLHPLVNVKVKFKAVVSSYPKNSGLASITTSGVPGRVHFFAFDVHVATEGVDGMFIQLVASQSNQEIAKTLEVGDIIDVTGELLFFGGNSQFQIDTINKVGNVYIESEYNALITFLNPVITDLQQLNLNHTNSGKIKWNPDSYSEKIHQYVKLNALQVIERFEANTGRPWLLLTDGTSKIYTTDISLRFRNDRGEGYAYDPSSGIGRDYNWRRLESGLDGPFTPPQIGDFVDISGYIVVNTFDPAQIDLESNQSSLKIAPWSDGIIWIKDGKNTAYRDLDESLNDLKVLSEWVKCGDDIIDIDGKGYGTKLIGNQCWMDENLRVSRYNDGTPIQQITLDDPTAWSTNTTGAWSYYNDDVNSNAIFGKLYNFHVVDNDKNICPIGWKVPSDDDWNKLSILLGNNAGQKMKSTSGWRDGGNGTNASGFNAQPAGRKGTSGTTYSEIGQAARFWSSTRNNVNNAWIYRLTFDSDELQRDFNQDSNGFSIRCVYAQDIQTPEAPSIETNDVTEINPSTAVFNGNISSDGNSTIVDRGFCYSTNLESNGNDRCLGVDGTTGSFNLLVPGLHPETTYYVQAYATNSVATSYGERIMFYTPRFECGNQYSDIDGKIYDTVPIGDQCWMDGNLRVSRFNDGTTIPEITLDEPVVWNTNSTGAWSYYGDNVSNRSPHGKLYNYYVVDNDKNVCPVGWKVPSDNEWSVLSGFLGTDAGQKMKSTALWFSNGNGTNSSGFNAVPSGRKGVSGTSYSELGQAALFWSSTENNVNNAWIYRLTHDSNELQRDYNQMGNGFSIRCMLDPTSVVSIDKSTEDLPQETGLHQNYPNPFNPSTQIRFALPELQQVTIRVYDINGRMIAELVNNQTYSAGNHQVTFDGAGLSTGIYIYNLTTNSGFTMSRKLVLIK